MFLSKRTHGIYYLYYTEKGKRKTITTRSKTKAGAMIFVANFRTILDERLMNKIRPIFLNKLIFEFLKYSESIHSTNHTKSLKSTFKGVVNYFGNINTSEITKGSLLDFIQCRARIVSAFAVTRDINSLSALFNWAVDHNYLKENICQGIKRPRLPEKMPKYFSRNEFQKLLESTYNEDLRDLFYFAVNTGLRQMELLRLSWTQIDLDRNILRLDNGSYLTKSKKVRIVPLNDTTISILKNRGNKTDKKNSVFTYQGKPMNQQFISHKIKKIIKNAGINPKLNFHSLRHTFASWLVQAGVAIYEVSKLMGHGSIRLTEIYAHLDPGNLREAVRKLET